MLKPSLYTGSCADLIEVLPLMPEVLLDADLIAGQTPLCTNPVLTFSTLEGHLCVTVDKVEESTAPALRQACNGIAINGNCTSADNIWSAFYRCSA
ncbi:MAG: hypothetical protein IPP37_20415 [Saprospiraceae bacterium]|nr:hypothetical protein [Saprospiraceae bacterium]